MPYLDYTYIASEQGWKFEVKQDNGQGVTFYNPSSWRFETGFAQPKHALYIGGSGADQIYLFASLRNFAWGNDGNDRIVVTYGGTNAKNYIYAGAGNDYVDCSLSTNTNVIMGDSGNDTLIGGSGADTITDTVGRNTIRGNGGNDTILFGDSSEQNSTIDGGDGNDSIKNEGIANDVSIVGGWGDDNIDVKITDSSIRAGANNDAIKVIGRDNFIYGGDGTDNINVNGSDNRIWGDDGNDFITVTNSGGGADVSGARVYGGNGADTINYCDNNGGFIFGGSGRDSIYLCDTANASLVYTRDDGRNNLDLVYNFDGDVGNVVDLRALNLTARDIHLNYISGVYTLSAGNWLTIFFFGSDVQGDNILI